MQGIAHHARALQADREARGGREARRHRGPTITARVDEGGSEREDDKKEGDEEEDYEDEGEGGAMKRRLR
eukprot:7251172-Pyramimonas_sp.AAC.1